MAELSGIAGIEPGPLTLRELEWAANARARFEWRQTSSVMALLANVHRNPKKVGPFKPEDFDPFARRRPGKVGVEALRVFVRNPAAVRKPRE